MAKLSFSPYLPNSPLSPTFIGPLHCFVFCLVGDYGKIVIFAIFAKFAAFANFYGPPSLLCALPRWRLWQNCHFRHICQIRRFRQLLLAPFTALCFASLGIVAKLSFSPYLPNLPLSPTFMGPLHCFVLCLVGDCGKIVIFALNSPLSPTVMGPLYCFVLCLVGDCGKIVIFAIFAKFAVFANFYGAPILLCALRRWRLWQNCHFRHICQIRRFRQLLWGPYTALCFASLAIVAKLSFSPYLPNSPLSPTFMGPVYCFVLCLVGDCGKIVIFAIFAKFAVFANFCGAPILLCALPRWRLWQNCRFRHICQIRRFCQLLWAPFTAFSFSSLAIVAKLSFSPYLPNSPLSPTFMGPLHCFVFCLVGDCGKIVIFVIFAKFAVFANFYGAPILLCALPRWRLWQNCHFRHICQIRRFCQLLWGPFTALCFASLAIVAKLSFSPYLPNSPTLSLFCNFCCCVHFWTYLSNMATIEEELRNFFIGFTCNEILKQLESCDVNPATEYSERKLENYVTIESGERSEHRSNLLTLLRALYELSYGKLEILSSQIQEQSCLQQKSSYYPQLEKTGGRPMFSLTKEQLVNLRETGLTWAKIAVCLNVSERTLYRRVQEFEIDGKFSDLSDNDLDELLKSIRALTPRAGESYIRGSLKDSSVRIQRWRIRERLNSIDPVGRATRRSSAIRRRVYNVRAPNCLWHIDRGDTKTLTPGPWTPLRTGSTDCLTDRSTDYPYGPPVWTTPK